MSPLCPLATPVDDHTQGQYYALTLPNMNFTIYFAVSGQLTAHVSIYDCGELDDYCVDNESVDGYEEQLDMTRNTLKESGMELVE